MEIATQQYFNKLKGYRISGGHFELGSSLHIRDYFYAKRLFYNSFYTNRFAFLITRFILETYQDKISTAVAGSKAGGRSSITLLGYENYSDLLVSNVRKMLNDFLTGKGALCDIFNHDICTKETLFLKNPERLSQDVALIFPISTTFSTSLKIQTEITEKLSVFQPQKKINFLNPVINCLVIAPEKLIESKLFSDLSPAYGYGWQNVNVPKRQISVIHIDRVQMHRPNILNSGQSHVEQKYLISLDTPWNNMDSCDECYPEDPGKEVCLIETKASSVTPNLIFGYPRSYAYPVDKNIFPSFSARRKFADSPVVYRKHIRKHGNNYIYYIRVGRFLKYNKEQVAIWLKDKCAPLRGLEDKNVVIVTPTLGSNSGFVNLVNDVLFSDIATIIQYNPKEEFLQNFKLFYTELLQRADVVIYVDDVLATTKSISELNFFVKQARAEGKGIDFSVSLINRTGYFNYVKLLNKFRALDDGDDLERIFNFINIHVPPIAHREKYPYLALVDKFHELASKSVLDTMRLYFKKREQKFMPVDLSQEFEDLKGAGEPEALLRFLVTHEFGKLFHNNRSGDYSFAPDIAAIFESQDGSGFSKLVNFVHQPGERNAIGSFLNAYPEFKGEIGYCLLRLCSSEPYIQHGKIKEAAFGWVLTELRTFVEDINEGEATERSFFEARRDGRICKFSRYQTFMFLLKRAAKLKLNYIFSLEVMESVSQVLKGIKVVGFNFYYQPNTPVGTTLFENSGQLEEAWREQIYPAQFITYYVGLLQELILEHESKALKMVYNIKVIIDRNLADGGNGRSLKNSYNDDFTHLLRLLVLENTFIFHSAAEKILRRNLSIGFHEQSYEKFMHDLDVYYETYPFLYTRHMLARFEKRGREIHYEPDKEIVQSFKYMMVLKAMFAADHKPSGTGEAVLIEDKLKRILEISCKVLGIKDGGAFFAVNYKNREDVIQQDDIAIVSEYRTDDEQEMDADSFTSASFLHHVFQGIQENDGEKPLSTFEATIDGSGYHHFRKNMALDYQNTLHFSEFQDKLYANIFYLRITEIKQLPGNEDFEIHPQAVLGFYHNPLDEKVTEAFISRQESAIEKTAKHGPVADQEGKRNYKRLDPKQVRQLLLLRNDLSGFINHHLNNDSLRAYIEMINNTKLSTSLKHGIGIYEKLFNTYTGRLNRYAEHLGPEIQQEVSSNTGFIKTIFSYLTNKMHLISLANDAMAYKGYEMNTSWQEKSLKDLVEEFKSVKDLIFKLEQDNFRALADEKIFFDAESISPKDLMVRFRPFPKLMKELVFEVLYNIKKHAVNDSYSRISIEKPLEIRLFTSRIEDTLFLCISNNYLIKTPRYIRQLNAKLSRKKGVDGLNLIYNILSRTTGRNLIVDAQDGYFNVYIPVIKFNKYENPDH